MPADVIMPMLGMAQDSGKVLRWLKAEGDAVDKGEPLLEVETDKVTVEVEAPAGGTLGGLRAAEGAEVPVGDVIAVVLAAGEVETAEPAGVATSVGDATPRQRERGGDATPRQRECGGDATPRQRECGGDATPRHDKSGGDATPRHHKSGGDATPRHPGRRRLASPKARRLARERGIDLDALRGSGPNGAVVAADVDSGPREATAAGLAVSPVWRTMAERTTRAWQEVPQFVLSREVDASRLQSWRAVARRKPGCEGVSHTDLLVKLCAEALRVHPRLNASWREGALVSGTGINVGIAVATDDGLVVPVVHRADTLDLAALAARRRQVVEAARGGRLRPEDVQGGTFTISNLGMYGVDAFQAIVNAPQAAILAVGRIVERPVALNGEVVVRPLLTLSVSFDHRVADGARGAEFLDTLAALVEEPAGLVA